MALGALEDRVQHEQVLVDRARREAALGDEVGAVGVHELGADGAQRQVPEQRIEDVVDHPAVVAHGRRTASAVELDVAQPLGGGV